MVLVIRLSRAAFCGVFLLCAAAIVPRALAQPLRESRALSGVDRVPDEFPTLQEAVEHGRAPAILVTSGDYAGATVDRPVAIVCAGHCMITSGPAIAGRQAGFVLEKGASGALIAGFDLVDVDLGVFASCPTVGSAPDRIAIVRNAFVNTAQGVTINGEGCEGGDGWTIARNRFHDLRSDLAECGGGLGVYLIAAERAAVVHNLFRGEIAAPPCGAAFTTAGVYLSGSRAVRIADNDFELGDGGHPFKLDIALLPERGANRAIVIAGNDARGSAAPLQGVNFMSVDGLDVTARCNTGTTAIEHAGSDGASERYAERGCRRLPAPAQDP